MSRLGAALHARRLALGLSMAEVARKAGLSRGYVNNLEKGRAVPSDEAVERLSPVLGLTPHEVAALSVIDRFGEYTRDEGLGEHEPGYASLLALQGGLLGQVLDPASFEGIQVAFSSEIMANVNSVARVDDESFASDGLGVGDALLIRPAPSLEGVLNRKVIALVGGRHRVGVLRSDALGLYLEAPAGCTGQWRTPLPEDAKIEAEVMATIKLER